MSSVVVIDLDKLVPELVNLQHSMLGDSDVMHSYGNDVVRTVQRLGVLLPENKDGDWQTGWDEMRPYLLGELKKK